MKVFVSTSIIILVIYFPAYSQLTDDFGDGDLLKNPSWENKSGFFVPENGMLRLNAPGSAGQCFLTTASNYLVDASWELRVKLDFNPSAYNYTDIYLVADCPDLEEHVLGYFIRIGSPQDDICLFRRNGNADQITKVIDGPDHLTDRDGIDFYLKVSRSRSGKWHLNYRENSKMTYEDLGETTDSLIQKPNFFGIYCRFTSSRSDKFWFDELKISGGQVPDLVPPAIDTVFCEGMGRVICRFNEKLRSGPAMDPNNYFIQDAGFPDSVVYHSGTLASVLYYHEKFINTFIYTIKFSSQQDFAGNDLSTPEYSFMFHDIRNPSQGKIVINEFMPEPLPPIGLPDAEYVELYNTTTDYILLDHCRLNNKSLETICIPPAGFMLLCRARDKGSFLNLNCLASGMEEWDPINNTGDHLILTDTQGDTLDDVYYEPSWFDEPGKTIGGRSIELIHPGFRCWGRKSWSLSNSPAGGTPGRKNSVDGIKIENSRKGYWDFTLTDNILGLEFADPVIKDISIKNFSIPEIQYILHPISSEKPAVIFLSLQDSLIPGILYNIKINNLKDCSGTYQVDTTINFGKGLQPHTNNILITEIMINEKPSCGLPETEYIELYNPGESIINLAGCRMSVTGDTISLPSKNLLPGEFRVLCPEIFEQKIGGHALGISRFPNLSNTREDIILTYAENWINEVNYNSDWFTGGFRGGTSMEMIDTHNPCGQADNWELSKNQSGGTPGSINSVTASNPDHTVPRLENVTALSDQEISIQFSEPVLAEGLSPSDLSVNNGESIWKIDRLDFQSLIGHLDMPLSPEKIYTLEVNSISDCAGNTLQDAISEEFALPLQADSLDLIINEVLFNPFPGGKDFIELYNNSKKFIDIGQWRITGGPASGNVASFSISNSSFIIKPGSYYAFTTDKNRTVNDYPSGETDHIIEIPDLPAMNDNEGIISLFTDDDKLIDRFNYRQDYHFKLYHDFEGVSLERIDPFKPTNDPSNWLSASEQAGFGTPGKKNSCSRPDRVIDGNILIVPRIFIPGDPAPNGETRINYSFKDPGYVANIRIFNTAGILVRKIACNELLSTEGYFTWNGFLNNGAVASPGYYIISFEIFNTHGIHRTILDKVAVGVHF